MSSASKYNIPEYTVPQAGLVTRSEGHFFFGDFSKGFDFPKTRVQPHRHPYFEIFWFPQARGAFLSDFETFELRGSTLVFVSPGQVHGWPRGHLLAGAMLAFDEAFLEEGERSLVGTPLFYDAECCPVVSVRDDRETGELWHQIGKEYGSDRRDRIAALRAYLRLLLISAHRLADGKKAGERVGSGTRIYQDFIRLLAGDLPKKHLPKDYARRLQVSPDYLSECVKRECGRSAGDLIRRRLTLESKRLLAHSDLTIAEIGYHLHFTDPSYFSRFFKQSTGKTPRGFREAADAMS
ncbi:MAG: helix-turn-helix domain-containing protein [Verrucomicrobiota bacterium]